MKPTIFFFCLLILSYTAFSHVPKKDFDYSIVFGGCFDKDIVSLRINNTSIFEQYRVDNKNAATRGNLSLTQASNKINLFYNGKQKFRGKVKVSFYLNIELVVNKQVKKFKVDLRKGKVILFDYCAGEEGRSETKKITVEQLQEEVIFM